MNSPIIETERLILRRFTDRDMEALFLILKDEEVNQFLPWYPLKDFIFRMYQLNFNGNTDFVYQKYWNESDHHFIEEL